MLIQDSFKRNSSQNLQLTDRAAIAIWQQSSSVDEAEEKKWSLVEQLTKYEASRDSSLIAEFKEEMRENIVYLEEAAKALGVDPDGVDKIRLSQVRAKVNKYAGPNRDGGCNEGFLFWVREERLHFGGGALKTWATRLRRKGVTSLKDLKRNTSSGYPPAYYEGLNLYAQNLLTSSNT